MLIKKRIEMAEQDRQLLPSILSNPFKPSKNRSRDNTPNMDERNSTSDHEASFQTSQNQTLNPKKKTRRSPQNQGQHLGNRINQTLDQSTLQLNYIQNLNSPAERRYFRDIRDLKQRYAHIKGKYSQSPRDEASRILLPNDHQQSQSLNQSPLTISLNQKLDDLEAQAFSEERNYAEDLLDQQNSTKNRQLATMDLANHGPKTVLEPDPTKFNANLPKIGPMRNYNVYVNQSRQALQKGKQPKKQQVDSEDPRNHQFQGSSQVKEEKEHVKVSNINI